MIELSLWNFYQQKYKDKDYRLYIMKNGSSGVLYVGISNKDVWERWFGWGGHITWDGNVVYGESPVGEKIVNHIPDSLSWKIQLWTLNDCLEYCGEEAIEKHCETINDIEPLMIKRLSPALNRTYNVNPSRDTTPKSEKELKWDAYVNRAYDEIFNKRK